MADAMITIQRDIFTGRRSELKMLFDAFESAQNGHGRVVVVSGEAGIGKTRLCEEFLDQVGNGDDDVQIIRSWCSEDVESPPFWPWIQVIRSTAQFDPSGFEEFISSPGGDLVAEILPERSTESAESEPGVEFQIDADRFRLFDSVSRWIAGIDPAIPRIVLVDDVHASDYSSQQLLKFLAREISQKRLLLLATTRARDKSDSEFVNRTLSEITRLQWVQHIILGPLDGNEIEAIVRATTDGAVSRRVSREVTHRSNGNPLFAVELARNLRESGILETGQLPEAIIEAISDRLRRISANCLRVLKLAAITRREFEGRFIHSLLDQKTALELPALFSEAVDANVLKKGAGGLDTYAFAHPLVRQTLYQGIDESSRQQLHCDIAMAIESDAEIQIESLAAELAFHFGRSGQGMFIPQVIHYSMLAGRYALKSRAFQEAHHHFTRALEHMDDDANLERAEATAALAVINFAEVPAGSKLHGWILLRRAFEMFLDVGERRKALNLASQVFPLWGRDGVVEFYQRVLTFAEPGTPLTGRLHTRLAIGLGDLGRPDEAMRQLNLADRIAIDTEDSWLKGRIAIQKAQVHYRLDKSANAYRWGRRAARIAVMDDLGEHQKSALQWQIFSLMSMGRLDEAEALNKELFAVARTTRVPFHFWTAISQGWNLARMRGDWERAYEMIELGSDLGPEDGYVELLRLGVEADRNGLDMHSSAFERWLEQIEQEVWRDTGPSLFNHICGVPELQAQVWDLAEMATEQFPNRLARIRRAIVLGLISCATNDARQAKVHYEFLKPVVRPLDEVMDISTERARGLVLATTGDIRGASAHFERSIEFCEKVGYRTEMARSLCDYAETMHRMSFENSPGRYDVVVEQATEISTALGMRPLTDRLDRLVSSGAADKNGTSGRATDLTMRETTVLKLLAAGLSNQEVANKLIISRYTVNNHVANIYTKIGARNRAEATAYAIRHNLHQQ